MKKRNTEQIKELTPTKIYNTFYPKLRSYFLDKHKGDYDLAKELAHEGVTKAILNLEKYKEKPNKSLNSWVFITARNHAYDFYRKDKIRFEKRNNFYGDISVLDNFSDISEIPIISNNTYTFEYNETNYEY